jgi:rRNA maturation endonuclease Nob1
MAKNKRGRGIKATLNWRGTCPLCSRTGVKLLWDKTTEAGAKLKVCKRCGN